MRFLALFLAAGVLYAQPDARALVRRSVENGERAWRRSFNYDRIEQEVEETLDSAGHVTSATTDVYESIPLGSGTSFRLHLTHNGVKMPEQEIAVQRRRLQMRRGESPADKSVRFRRELQGRSYLREVPSAFDFRIVGTENLPTGPAWVIEAKPHPGYQPHSRYARIFSGMAGKLWVDQHDVQWVKADAKAMNTVSFGFFVARFAKGSRIVLEQMRLPDGEWVPWRIQAKAQARILLFFNNYFEETITYKNYHAENGLPAE